MIEKYGLFYALALIAEILGTVSGFGSSLLFVPIASLFFDFKLVLGITAIFHVFSNLSKIALFRNGINKHIIITLGIPAVIAVALGALLTSVIPIKEIELILGIVLIFLALYLLFNINKSIKPNNANLMIGGGVSGFMAGLVGTGGAFRGLVLASFNMEKNVFVATSACVDLGVDFTRACIYVAKGYFQMEYLVLLPILLIVSIVGSWIGKQILSYINPKIFKYIVLFSVMITAVIQIIKFFK